MKHNCKLSVKFSSELGAPGIGYCYTCTVCGKKFHTYNRKDFHSYSEINVGDTIMDINDVI